MPSSPTIRSASRPAARWTRSPPTATGSGIPERDDIETRPPPQCDHRGARNPRRAQGPDAGRICSRSSRPWPATAPDGRRMAARDQIRRLSAARPHRGRQGPADHPQRARLDRQIPGARASPSAQLPVDTALIDGELVHLAADGTTSFLRPAGRDRERQDRCAEFLRLRPALSRRLGPDRRGARRPQGGARRDHSAAVAGDLALQRPPDRPRPGFLRQACSYGSKASSRSAATRALPARARRSWLKIKCRNREEFVVIGFTDPEGSREGFGALLAGYYDPSEALRYAGRVGTGFSAERLAICANGSTALAVRTPSVVLPKEAPRKGVHWVRAALVAEVEFAGWTADAILRHASFQGLREDKNPSEVVYDPKHDPPEPPSQSTTTHESPVQADTEVAPARPRRQHDFRGRAADPSRPRALSRATALTKLDLARYYAAVAGLGIARTSRIGR